MSSMSTRNFGLSSSLEEEVLVIKKQGIVSILGYSDSDKTKAASLRRTLSADMSSKKWLSQHGLSPLKKIASSEELPIFSCEEDEDEEVEPENGQQFEIWKNIQHQQNEKQKLAGGQFDIWSSIVSDKQECNNSNDVLPYVHPLVKRSATSLSEKSLQICTESLGSETGSDGFSSHPASETEDEQHGPEDDVKEAETFEGLALPVEMYGKTVALPRSFPPPLPSLSKGDGTSLHMRPRRDNDRFVLEAISFPSQNNFRAERQDGRLVLTFINNEGVDEAMKSEGKIRDSGLFKVDLESEGEDEGTESETETDRMEARFPVPKLGGGVMNVHRLALMMNKSALLANRNRTWCNKFTNEEEEVEDKVLNTITPPTQSLLLRPPVGGMISMTPAATAKAAVAAGAGSLNAYGYYWKAKPMAAPLPVALVSPLPPNSTTAKNKMASNEKKELVVLRGNQGHNYLLRLSSKVCKQPRRSVFFWEPYCIATS